MTRQSLAFRNLRHFTSANLLIVLGVVIGTAVLTGALLLGDSLKGSLKSQTLDRLGEIDLALVSERFFPASLSQRIAGQALGLEEIVPAVILRGSVLRRDSQGSKLLARAGQVQIVGIDRRFWKLFRQERDELPSDAVLINQALADALQMQSADGLEVRNEKPQAVPAESVLGKRSESAALVIETSRLAGILPNQGPGRFTLQPRHEEPLILYVQLDRIQRRLARDQQLSNGSVNALLVMSKPDQTAHSLQAEAQRALTEQARLEDLGFSLRPDSSQEKFLILESRRLLLEQDVESAVLKICRDAGYRAVPTLTYLANRTYRIDSAKLESLKPSENKDQPVSFTPYSAIIGLHAEANSPFGQLLDGQGGPLPVGKEDEIIINEFVARDLWPDGNWQASLGKPAVRIEYFVEADGHQLVEAQHDFRLAGVAALSGLGAERTLTPEFPGMKGTRIADWEPPFPKDQWHPEWVRPKDEEYYKQHRATPKLFIHPQTAQKLFKSRFGQHTSIRIAAPGLPLAEVEKKFRSEWKNHIDPKTLGYEWQPVKTQGLLAATQGGTTNMFGGLFAGFSLFLIVSAALLVGLLFRLRTERRAGEIGLLLATGWGIRKTRRLLLTEGLYLAMIGAGAGIFAALGYAALVIQLMHYGWGGMLASDSLKLHYTVPTLLVGATLSVVISLLAIVWPLRGLVRLPVPQLLAGKTTTSPFVRQKRSWTKFLPWLVGLLAMGLIVVGITQPADAKPGCFFGAGFLCLLALVLGVRRYLHDLGDSTKTKLTSIGRLGRMNAARAPGRSISTIALLACGCFLVVSVGAFRKDSVGGNSSDSATGGYSLLAESDVPFRANIADEPLDPLIPPNNAEKELVGQMESVAFRLKSGEDVSCMNLYQPQKPRILGVPLQAQNRGLDRFRIDLWRSAGTVDQGKPWSALTAKLPDGAVPVMLDDHTAQWVLQKKLGDAIDLQDETGKSVSAVLVGMLKGSIFQSEVLMSEESFRKLYPSEGGYQFYLVRCPGPVAPARTALESLFGESHGLVVRTTESRLAMFHAVENTYISTFQALGALGLLLGTAGLAIVILRNVQERKEELAVLQAMGFSKKQVGLMIFYEVGWLVLMGLLIGCTSALIVVLPPLIQIGGAAWQLAFWFGLVILLVPLVAILSAAGGIVLALRTALIPALRGE